ncbi:plasmid maintenance toxin/Cell growth inhibitor [Glomus cerebriforme]|uniref:Plasmid maintenance toxin/Cell growth inhibitor n=1 Tax=Glomus cerebriforme TaxID=658196 RepID=A0A397SDM9_9GLOM|nr:plasmid maintenance toxin/Cell growth inhibitor [Glomus cerebriforme]
MNKLEEKVPQQGEIWLVKFPKIKEFSKTYRPAVAISNNFQNKFDKLITVATLTTENLENIRPFEVFINNTPETGLEKPSKVIVSYSFTIYKQLRLIKKLGVVSEEIKQKIKQVLKITFDLED